MGSLVNKTQTKGVRNMRKRLIGIAALLCLTALAGCQKGGSSSTDSSNSSISSSSSENSSNTSSADTTVHVSNVAITPGRATVYLSNGNTVQFQAIVTPENADNKSVTWSSSNTSIATVDETGLVTCHAQGTASITATSNDDATKKTSATLIVKQYESQEETLNSLDSPAFYETYKRNTQTLDKVNYINDSSKTLLATTFFENQEESKDPYRVGTDNPFKLNITGKVTDKDGVDSMINDPHILVEVSKYNEITKTYTKLEDAALADHLTIAQDKKSVDFKDEAAGNKYRLTIKADSSAYGRIGGNYADINLDIEVVKGYNVYDKADLSLFDNCQAAWNEVKTANGIADVVTSGLVLHSNITITNDDVPASFKYSQQEVETYISSFGPDFNNWCAMKSVTAEQGKDLLIGSFKDRGTLFSRETKTGQENFTFDGNYFKVDCSGIKQVYAFTDDALQTGSVAEEYMPSDPTKGCEGSHAQLFGINEYFHRALPEGFYGNGKVVLRNATVIGNGDLSNDDKYLGGLITFKFNSVDFLASNILTSKSFTTFICEMNDLGVENVETITRIDRCKCYDSYNSMVYVWGVEKNYITNSVMQRAGGAIALLDEVNASDPTSDTHGTPKVDCYNCDFNNPVTGAEPWFVGHKASQLVQMMALFGDIYTPNSNRWLGRNANSHGEHMNILTLGQDGKAYVNLIAVDIDGRSPLSNSLSTGGEMLRGHFNVYNDALYTNLKGGLDMGKLAAADPRLGMETFGGQVLQEALVNGNYLPTYRMIAASQGAQGIIAATKTGHAMLSDAPTTENGVMDISTGFRNGIVADYNNPISLSGVNPALPVQPMNAQYSLTPIPFYADNTGTGDEVAGADYMQDRLTPVLDGLASGDYMSIYLQPSASTEYLGAFIKMQKIGA